MTKKTIFGTVISAILLLIARLGFAAILLAHAWWRWSIAGMDVQIATIAASGLPQPEIFAWGTIVLEVLGGALLALGMLTRLISNAVIVQNEIIIAWIKWSAGIYLAQGGFEYNAALIALGIVFTAVGCFYTGFDAILFRGSKGETDTSKIEQYYPQPS